MDLEHCLTIGAEVYPLLAHFPILVKRAAEKLQISRAKAKRQFYNYTYKEWKTLLNA